LQKRGDILAIEVVNEIKNAEAKAEDIIKSANLKSKEMINNAMISGQEQYNKIIEQSKSEGEAVLKKATEEALKDSEPISIRGIDEINIINNLDQNKRGSAVKLIIERIVNIHGNS
jgi:V/A-type H+-transporting ATPase subunit G/H